MISAEVRTQYSKRSAQCACGRSFEHTADKVSQCLLCRRKNYRAKVEKQCEHCKCAFKTTRKASRFCSAKCGNVKRKRTEKVTCEGCNTTFLPKNPHYRRFCSRACAFKNFGQWLKPQPVKSIVNVRALLSGLKYCAACQYIHASASPYCSDCRPSATYTRMLESCKEKYRKTQSLYLSCRHCKKTFERKSYTHKPRYCKPCADAISRLQKREAKARRRAYTKGLTVNRACYVQVCERASWCCEICYCMTDASADTTNDVYPNIDHIIPLAKGGVHAACNLQLLCRKCNLVKSDSVTTKAMVREARCDGEILHAKNLKLKPSTIGAESKSFPLAF